jgi:hypothetical protein
MARNKIIGKDEKVGLKLTQAERKLILEDPIHIHDELADPIRSTPTPLDDASWPTAEAASASRRRAPLKP